MVENTGPDQGAQLGIAPGGRTLDVLVAQMSTSQFHTDAGVGIAQCRHTYK